MIAATQDFITGGYLLTQKDCFFDRGKVYQEQSEVYVYGNMKKKTGFKGTF